MNNDTQPFSPDQVLSDFEVCLKQEAEKKANKQFAFFAQPSVIKQTGKSQPEEEEQIESPNHPSVTSFLQMVKAGIEANLPPKPPHVHGPFTFLMNQNHNALRGCTTCGATWVGTMAGVTEADLQWHPVQELEEEEEEG